jgi:cytochrome c peroxidase
VVALDEVAISRIFRTPEEFSIAAFGREPAGPPMGGAELLPGIEIPMGLDAGDFIVPAWSRNTDEVVELGMMLFFDTRLSSNGEVSCATCHDPEMAWTDGRAVGRHIDGGDLARATPTIFNRVTSTRQFWDGRSRSVEAQALSPIGSPAEMNMPLNQAVEILNGIPEYVEMFEAAFGRGPDIGGMANAISAFERRQLAGESPVDLFEAGDTDALTAAEQRGRLLFHGKARCASCHSGSNYSDEDFHNVGILGGNDLGRFYSSGGRNSMFRAFKTPTLRNIAVTGPYFHNGSVETLEEVVALYNVGPTSDNHDWESRPLGLTDQEEADLVAFLEALTSPNASQTFDIDLPGDL